MNTLTSLITNLLVGNPRLAGAFGLMTALCFGYLGIASWQDMQSMPMQPRSLALSAAAAAVQADGESQWVALEQVSWDCDNILREGDRTSVIFSDPAQSVLGLATFSGPQDLACEDLDPGAAVGVLRLMGEGEYERLDDRGFDLTRHSSAKTRVALCTFCGPRNSQIGVALGIILVVAGLSLYPLSLRAHRARPRVRLLTEQCAARWARQL